MSKKISKKKIILPIVLIVIIILIIVGQVKGKSGTKLQELDVAKVKKGDITATLETSGTIGSEDIRNYASPVSAEVDKVSVQAGDVVKAGDYLLTYNTQSLEKSYTIADLQAKADSANSQKSIEMSDKSSASIAEAESQINAAQANINVLNGQLETLEEELKNAGDDQSKTEEINSQISAIQAQLESEQTNLAEAKSAKEAGEASVLTAAERQSISYTQQAATLTLSQTADELSAAKAGITAEFDGIVTSVDISAGGMAQEGTSVISVANASLMCVDFKASKYNLQNLAVGQSVAITLLDKTYEGTISNISRIADADTVSAASTTGAAMAKARVHINNPDENLIIGLDAELTVNLGKAEDVLYVPIAAVNTDSTGDFVFTLKNNTVKKKYVTTGMASKDNIEITKGLKKGEQVVTTIDSSIEDGMEATTKNASDTKKKEE